MKILFIHGLIIGPECLNDNPKRGLRIDHIMVSDNLTGSIKSTGISYDARALEKPSDHCPIWIDLK